MSKLKIAIIGSSLILGVDIQSVSLASDDTPKDKPENEQGSEPNQGGTEPLGHRRHFPTMKTCCSVMLRVNPSLKARARSTAGAVSLMGLS